MSISHLKHKHDAASKVSLKAAKEKAAIVSETLRDLDEDYAQSTETQDIRMELGPSKTKRDDGRGSKDRFSIVRSAEPKTKRETERSGESDAQPWWKTGDDYSSATERGEERNSPPSPDASTALFPVLHLSKSRSERPGIERDQDTLQIPRQESRELLRKPWVEDYDDIVSAHDPEVSSLQGKLYGEIPLQSTPAWYQLPYPDEVTEENPNMRSNRIVPAQPKTRIKKVVTVKRRTGGTSMPPPAPNLNIYDTTFRQVTALESYFRTTLLPLCNEYISHLPTDQKTSEWEHRKLSETILSQVLLQADGIEVDDDSTRNARHKLVDEAQATLKRLDDAFNKFT